MVGNALQRNRRRRFNCNASAFIRAGARAQSEQAAAAAFLDSWPRDSATLVIHREEAGGLVLGCRYSPGALLIATCESVQP